MGGQPEEVVEVALAVTVRGGRVLVARRDRDAHLGGLWEFPGGKIERGEEPEAAALRELAEETGLDGNRVEPLTVFHYAYPDRNVRLHAFLVTEPRGEVAIAGGRSWEWVEPAALASLPMPEANRAILRALAWRTGGTA